MVLTACHLVPPWDGVPAALTPQELPRLHPAGPWGPRRAWEDQELLGVFFGGLVFFFIAWSLDFSGKFSVKGCHQIGAFLARWVFPPWGERVGESLRLCSST